MPIKPNLSQALAPTAVPTPEWPDNPTSYVRGMKAGERLAFEAAYAADEDRIRRLALLVRYTACDAAGALIFDDGDIDALIGQPATLLWRLWNAAIERNKIGDGAIEEAAKN